MKKPTTQHERIDDLQILDELKNSYLNYAMSVIVSRALPDVRDGLKPSQRRILVAMNDLNLGPRSRYRKCAKIAGDTSGNYHPHGEGVVYPTLVRMGQHWSTRYPLIEPQGNFGSIDGDPPAAMRYTEARMSAVATEMLEDLNRDTVDFVPNYDETRREPTVLPAKFPNLLVNGATGIAVGMATNIAPHNLGEVCDALLLLIDDPNCGFKDILKKLPGPDFPTGAVICGKKGILDAYTTGRGHLTVRARVDIDAAGKGRPRIIVTEIPYMVVKTTIISKIADSVNKGLIPEIADVRDESDRHGLRIVVDLKKEADEQIALNKLYRYTPLQSSFGILNVALVNNRPEVLNIKQMLRLFIEHRKQVIRRRSRWHLTRCRNRAHILEGLILAVSDIDEIIDLIKRSPDAPTAKLNLMKKPLRLAEVATLRKILPENFVREKTAHDHFLTGPQADAILNMQLSRLTGLEVEKLAKEYAQLIEQIADYEALLASEQLLLDVIREDIHELKEKHADPRRTQLVADVEEFDIEDLIAEEQVIVTISHGGYIKRMPLDTYRKQARGGRGIIGSDTREGDFIEHLFIASTHEYLLILTNRGKCYWLKVYDIPKMSRQSKGRNIVNLLPLGGQSVTSIINVRDFDQRQLVMATRTGLVKKTVLSAYGNPRSTGVIAIKLDPANELIGAAITTGTDQIVLGTADGMAIRFSEDQIRSTGRASMGVHGVRLRPGDEVVDMAVVPPDSKASLLTVCEKGYGKRTDLSDYRLQGRGGIGLKNIRTSERNGKVVALKTVESDDELMMITAKGIIIRTGLDELRAIGRNTQGVRLIKLGPDDKLVAVAKLITEEENLPESEEKLDAPESDNNADSPEQDSEKAEET